MLLVGSHALIENGIDIGRKPMDYDYICTYEEYAKFVKDKKPIQAYPISGQNMVAKFADGRIYEFEIAWPGSSAEAILDAERNHTYASLDMLFLLKSSHKYAKQVHFWKTLHDYHLMKDHGAMILKEYKSIYKQRVEETNAQKKTPRLNVNKEEFFTDNVKYIVEHDTLHEALKHLDKPAYQYYAIEGEEVLSSKKKFFESEEQVRLYGCLEEQLVLSTERMLLPNNFKPNPTMAAKEAFKRAMFGIVGGWFRDYWYDNFPKVWALYNENYVEKVKTGLENGVIKPYKKSLETT